MSQDPIAQVSQDRRARLAAERLLQQRDKRLGREQARLEQHALRLTDAIITKRQELEAVQQETERLQNQIAAAEAQLNEANSTAAESEQQLWQALQIVRDGFAIFDADHRLVVANRAYLSIFEGLDCVRPGISYVELCELMVAEGIVDPQGCRQEWRDRMIRRWDSQPVAAETICLWNGEFVKLVDRPTPDGGMVTLGVNQTDILRITAATEMMPDGFILYDRDDRMVMCNQRYKDMYPLIAPAMIPGATYADLLRYGLKHGQFPVAIGREEAWLEQRLTRHRSSRELVDEQQLADGRWVRTLESATPDGGRVGLWNDVTSLKQYQLELETARETAEASNKAKSVFLANMSHELRTPMNGIMGMAQLLQEADLPTAQREMAATMHKSASTLLGVLDDILDFSQIEAEKVVLRDEIFDVEAILHEVLHLVLPQDASNDLDIIVDCDLGLPPRLTGDRGRLRQVLLNVVGNAVKFTPDGHILIRVSAEVSQDRVQLCIAVEDTGPGVDPTETDRIFNEFTQADGEHTRDHDGNGLGLAIARKLARMMGGDVTLRIDHAHGAAFDIHVDLAPANAAPLVQQPLFAEKQRIFLAQTQGLQRASLARFLTALGLDVIQTDSAAGVLDARPEDIVCVSVDAFNGASKTHVGEIVLMDTKRSVLIEEPQSPRHVLRRLRPEFDQVLTLPLRRANVIAALAPQVNGPTELADRAARPSRLRVLAAEDNRTNQLVLRKMLEGQCIDLELVNNGRDAVSRFEAAPWDLVFMDISMPVLDGKQATQQIRAIEAERKTKPVPIVAMTAHSLAEDVAQIKKAGVNVVMHKPIEKSALVDVITEAQAALGLA